MTHIWETLLTHLFVIITDHETGRFPLAFALQPPAPAPHLTQKSIRGTVLKMWVFNKYAFTLKDVCRESSLIWAPLHIIQIYHSWEALVESMGSEVPSAVLFSEGRSPEENSRQWKEPKAHRFNWCLEKRNDIFVLYPSSTTFMEASSYFHVFMLVTFLLILLRLRACMHVHRPKCSLSNSKLILTSNAALSMSILA